ncbi:MAG TPA: M28 family peptidase [Candidatus Cloacimonadota bacterium]|nr:M28 family peptidase [Candidatus Cloacimonadota bacterium]
MMRIHILLMISLLFTFVLPVFSLETPYLIRIDITQINDIEHFKQLQLPLYHRKGNDLFIGIDQEGIKNLHGIPYQVIDDAFTPQSTYILTSEKGKNLQWNDAWGKLLWQTSTEFLIKSNDDMLLKMKGTPFMAVPLLKKPVYFDDQHLKAPTSMNMDRTIIQDMVNQVNADSIQSDIQHLQDFVTRYYAASTLESVTSWIQNQFIRMGYTDVQIGTFSIGGYTQHNVIATLPGNITPNQNIVVGGHSDDNISFGNTDPMVFCPGADDNASGVAAVLEMARVFKLMNYQPASTFRFVTFGCEEMGLFGSQFYSQDLHDMGAEVKLMLNHDMIATHDDNYDYDYVVLEPYTGYDAYTQFTANMTYQYTGLVPVLSSYDSEGSDSYNFFLRGFPCVYFEELDFSPHYHSATDLIQYLDMDFCSRVIKSSLATAATMSSMPLQMPEYNIQDTGTGTSLQISWNPSAEPNITGYKVYIADDNSAWDQTFDVTGLSTTIEGLTSGQHYYVGLSCVNAQNFESLILVREATPQIDPRIPQNVQDHPLLNAIDITWDANNELDIAGYRIFRSTISGELGNQLNTEVDTQNTYHDTSVEHGVYYYYQIKAEDANGNLSAASEQIYSRAVSLDMGVLIIDGTANGTGTSYNQPSDEQVDNYYNELLSSYQTTQIDLSVYPQLKLADFGPFSTIVWHCNTVTGVEQAYNLRDEVQKYLVMGGNILISTYQPTLAWDLNSTYPTDFPTADFIRSVFKISHVEFSNAARFKYAIPTGTEYPSVMVDSLKSSASLNHHIFKIEGLTAAADGVMIYTYGSDYANNSSQGVLNGTGVGIGYFGQDYKSVVLSFPLWNMNQNQAKQMMEYILTQKFNEPVGNHDLTSPMIGRNELHQNYPNPFNPETMINYVIAKPSNVTLFIYNVKGQKVRALVNEYQANGHHQIKWNGEDDNGKTVSSGVYFYRLDTGIGKLTRKMIMLK